MIKKKTQINNREVFYSIIVVFINRKKWQRRKIPVYKNKDKLDIINVQSILDYSPVSILPISSAKSMKEFSIHKAILILPW